MNTFFSNHSKKNFSRGFTMVEMIIYVAIFSLFMVSIFSFMYNIDSVQLRDQAMHEAHEQGERAVRIITQTIRNGVSISAPTIGTQSGVLTVRTNSSSTDPTIFSASAGTLYVTEGSNSAVALTNSRVSVSNLVFTNLSLLATPGAANVRFTLTTQIAHKTAPVNYSVNFYGAGAIR